MFKENKQVFSGEAANIRSQVSGAEAVLAEL
jgi:hypothetical protein